MPDVLVVDEPIARCEALRRELDRRLEELRDWWLAEACELARHHGATLTPDGAVEAFAEAVESAALEARRRAQYDRPTSAHCLGCRSTHGGGDG